MIGRLLCRAGLHRRLLASQHFVGTRLNVTRYRCGRGCGWWLEVRP